jgi:hypothetical protein
MPPLPSVSAGISGFPGNVFEPLVAREVGRLPTISLY